MLIVCLKLCFYVFFVGLVCIWKGGCKEKDQIWFDFQMCIKYGCYEDEDGLDVNEIIYGSYLYFM